MNTSVLAHYRSARLQHGLQQGNGTAGEGKGKGKQQGALPYNPWMQAHSAYLTRSLDPLVTSLLRDGVPFLLTFRPPGEDDGEVGGGDGGGGSGGGGGSDGSAAPRGAGEVLQRRRDPRADPPPPKGSLYSLFLELPTGILWEVLSFDIDDVTAAALATLLLRRPCDPPLSKVPRLPRVAPGALNARWYREWAAGAGNPNPRDYIAYSEVYPSADPAADARAFRRLVGWASADNEDRHVGALRTVHTVEGRCESVKFPQSALEVRFESFERLGRPEPWGGGGGGGGGGRREGGGGGGDGGGGGGGGEGGGVGGGEGEGEGTKGTSDGTEGGSDGTGHENATGRYTFAQFVEYRKQLHRTTIAEGDYNSFMDDHIGILFGTSGTLPAFLRRLRREQVPFLTRGRNNFESVLLALPESGAVLQFLWVDDVKEVGSSYDMPLPGCKDGRASRVRLYQRLVEGGVTAEAIRVKGMQ
jgi:hypothetical protein